MALRLIGSSPLARGTRTCPLIIGLVGSAVHPRLRGEHAPTLEIRPGYRGSSPLARGTQVRVPHEHPLARFIPACAGNTHQHRQGRRPVAVHPRLRGEHVRSQAGVMFAVRFIPACAGNTADYLHMPSSLPVHPRLRGEHLSRLGVALGEGGSSPLARGTPLICGMYPDQMRFIPACAGNTLGRPKGSTSTAGSSPLARGTLGFVSIRWC